jgi:hypothetical protein
MRRAQTEPRVESYDYRQPVERGALGHPVPAAGRDGRAGFPARRTMPEVFPAGGAAVGEHPAGEGEDGKDEEAGANKGH